MIAKRVFLAFIITGMIVAIARAQSGSSSPSREANKVKKNVAVKLLGDVKAKIVEVNCGAGETILKALKKAEPGDTIRVTGTCNERVVITTDRLPSTGKATPSSTVAAAPRRSLRGW